MANNSLRRRNSLLILTLWLAAIPASAQSPMTLAHALVERLPPIDSNPAVQDAANPDEPDDTTTLPLERIPTPVPSSSPELETVPTEPEPIGPLPEHSVAPSMRWYSPLSDWLFTRKTPEGKKIWERSVELGIDGSDGNSNTFNIRFGADMKRKTELEKFKFDFDYYKAESNREETANQAFLDLRYERQLRQSRLNWFLNGNIEHDAFKIYDLRLTINTGAGYRLIHEEKSTLTVRFGAGASHEIGGPEPVYIPELVYGVELDHQLTERQKIGFHCDYFPDVSDFRRYRIDAKASWQVLLDQASNLSLKLSAHDRYDATAYEISPNDLDYSAVLLWEF